MCCLCSQGLVHMTGGGFPENIPRVIPKGLQCRIRRDSWEIPSLFQWIQQVHSIVTHMSSTLLSSKSCLSADARCPYWQAGGIADAEMFRTFNMGVGMIIVVDQKDVEAVLHAGLGAFRIGDIVQGEGVTFV